VLAVANPESDKIAITSPTLILFTIAVNGNVILKLYEPKDVTVN
jgi:hypothetical protein